MVPAVGGDLFRIQITGLGMDYRTATMDGSLGFKGLVTDLMVNMDPGSIDYIYTCGPEP